jgi:hypothetical protein
MRRFTWRHEAASVMEAVLIHGETLAVTLIIAPDQDIARALERSRCAPVRTESAFAHFPVAGTIRGERVPFAREVPAAVDP